jgi:SAM-dependent methyltransferase
MSAPEWTSAEHVRRYLSRADEYPRRLEGEGVLLDHVPRGTPRILDLGTGDGRLLALLRADRPAMIGVGLDFSALMLDAARERFAGDERIGLVEHDLTAPLPALGRFDAVVSSMAIHHLEPATSTATGSGSRWPCSSGSSRPRASSAPAGDVRPRARVRELYRRGPWILGVRLRARGSAAGAGGCRRGLERRGARWGRTRPGDRPRR